MDPKELRANAPLNIGVNDDNSKYVHSSPTLSASKNKTYNEVAANSVGKMDATAARPCAIIGPDRVHPQTPADVYLKKASVEPWPCSENIYRQPPEYPNKLLDYQPNRNISPRQTFQENMQRIMVPPTYSSTKDNDEVSLKSNKMNMPQEAKYCDVPYNMTSVSNEHKSARNSDIPMPSVNPAFSRSASHYGWPAGINIRPHRPYGAPEFYHYPEYSSSVGPRSATMSNQQRIHREEAQMYSERLYQEANIRFKPYPISKEKQQQPRYDYNINNYPNNFHPPISLPPHKFDLQKPIHNHPYPVYPQVPIKFLDRRVHETFVDGYQRPNQPLNFNPPFHNQMIPPPYGPISGNCVQNKSFSDLSSKAVTKLPYDANNKIYFDLDSSRNKGYPLPENVYYNDMNQHMRNEIVLPNHQINMHSISKHQLYRRENMPLKPYEYNHHYRNIEQPVNFNYSLTRLPLQYSPNSIAISPSDSNTSNDTTHTMGTSQEDCGYVSQSSTTSVRSLDTSNLSIPKDIYRRHDIRVQPMSRNTLHMNGPEQASKNKFSSSSKKNINVRQFLQMWNEGEEETNESNKVVPQIQQNCFNSPSEMSNSQEQLYVLGLVNVPNEELSKYEHIQKISKLPENIKGYNSLELLNKYEELLESPNNNKYKLPPKLHKENYSLSKRMGDKENITLPRPVSPLDVEAKISQSVIHKEVGCNFEIKPCSPEMLNVDVPTPIHNLLGERMIEKVANPIIAKSPMLTRNEDIVNLDNSNSKAVSTSCDMVNKQFPASNYPNIIRNNNYTVQDFESNSGLCLASLPRLDNEIELNFPEINQQFIKANQIETGEKSRESLPQLDEDQISLHKKSFVKVNTVSSPVPALEKEVSKLSKYRKSKKCDLMPREDMQEKNNTVIAQQRIDSVIIKNPDTIKYQDNNIPVLSANKDLRRNDYGTDNHPDPIVETTVEDNREILSFENAIDFSLAKIEEPPPYECINKIIEPSYFSDNISFLSRDIIGKDDIVETALLDLQMKNTKQQETFEERINFEVDTEYCNHESKENGVILTHLKLLENKNENNNIVESPSKQEVILLAINDEEITSETLIKNNLEGKEIECDVNVSHINNISNTNISNDEINKLPEDHINREINEKQKANKPKLKEIKMSCETKIGENILDVSHINNISNTTDLSNDEINKLPEDYINREIDEKEKGNKPKLEEIVMSCGTIIGEKVLDDVKGDEIVSEMEIDRKSIFDENKVVKSETAIITDELKTHGKNELKENEFYCKTNIDEKETNDINEAVVTKIYDKANIHQKRTDNEIKLEENKVNLEAETLVSQNQAIIFPNAKDIVNKINDIVTGSETTENEKDMMIDETMERRIDDETRINTMDKVAKINLIDNKKDYETKKDEKNTNDSNRIVDKTIDYVIKLDESKTICETEIFEKEINDESKTEKKEIYYKIKLEKTEIICETEIQEKELNDENELEENEKLGNNNTTKDDEGMENKPKIIEQEDGDKNKIQKETANSEIIIYAVNSKLENNDCVNQVNNLCKMDLFGHIATNTFNKKESFIENKLDNFINTASKSGTENLSNNEIDDENKINTFKSYDNTALCKNKTEFTKTCDLIYKNIYVKSPNILNAELAEKGNFELEIDSDKIKEKGIHKELVELKNIDDSPLNNERNLKDHAMDYQNIENIVDIPKNIHTKALRDDFNIDNEKSNSEVYDKLKNPFIVLSKNDQDMKRNSKDLFKPGKCCTEISKNNQNIQTKEPNENAFNKIEIKTNVEKRKRLYFGKKLHSPWIQKLFLFTEGICIKNHKSKIETKKLNNSTIHNANVLEINEVLETFEIFPKHDEETIKLNVIKKSTDEMLKEPASFSNKDKCSENIPSDLKIYAENNEEISNSPLECTLFAHNSLKRSLSESALEDYKNDHNTKHLSKRKKSKNIIQPIDLCNMVITNRRNSISALCNEDNVFILIDNDFIITEENDESDKIYYTEMIEECRPDIEKNESEIYDTTCVNNHTGDLNLCQNSNLHVTEEEPVQETWLGDVACIETVVSDDITEDIDESLIDEIISPKKYSSCDDDTDIDKSVIYCDKEHLDKVKNMYGNNMCSNDTQILQTLYMTPQMNVNKTLNDIESHNLIEQKEYESVENSIETQSNYHFNKLEQEIISYNNGEIINEINISHDDDTKIQTNELVGNNDFYLTCENDKGRKESTVHSCDSKNDISIYSPKNTDSNYSNSSSPEVSSTTSEERNSSILLKITNYNGSRVSEVNEIGSGVIERISYKLTEKNDYQNYNCNFRASRTLITKAAQKYIPPIRDTIGDLKVKLNLPQDRLHSLKQLKISKIKPKAIEITKKCVEKKLKHDIPKKQKPKFEDVLKSIDEIQYKKHKDKIKKGKNVIPKVVIKKNENGAHYASSKTTNIQESYNPDLTGRKWQPWVFLEKNNFIDKMATRKKINAVYCHRKKCYVLADKFRKYKSIYNANFIITQPRSASSANGNLKYTIRLKHK